MKNMLSLFVAVVNSYAGFSESSAQPESRTIFYTILSNSFFYFKPDSGYTDDRNAVESV